MGRASATTYDLADHVLTATAPDGGVTTNAYRVRPARLDHRSAGTVTADV